MLKKILTYWIKFPIVYKMGTAIIAGVILGVTFKDIPFLELIANLFIGSLKAIAPVLVFFLICSSLINASHKVGGMLTTVVCIYLLTTFISAMTTIAANFFFPITITLNEVAEGNVITNIEEVVSSQILHIVDNPLKAIMEANYLSILFWAILLGILLKKIASTATINILSDLSSAITKAVGIIVRFAPYGILGLVYISVSRHGIDIFYEYGQLILLLISTMLFVAFVINPVIVAILIRKNPYPLVLTCIRESGITAFFTRSSAANIPINMKLCERLGLDSDFYSVSIALGSTINMNGAAITISTITLVICNTIGIEVNFMWALLLCIVAVLAACGASGVAGGSLLLIPLSCSLFGISDDIAMQGVFVGFIIGSIQDSFETALNSSSDVLFTTATQYYHRRKSNIRSNFTEEQHRNQKV